MGWFNHQPVWYREYVVLDLYTYIYALNKSPVALKVRSSFKDDAPFSKGFLCFEVCPLCCAANKQEKLLLHKTVQLRNLFGLDFVQISVDCQPGMLEKTVAAQLDKFPQKW